jgi:hypothetical protein
MMPSDECLFSLSKCMQLAADSLTVNIMNASKQQNPGNCGLFAIAYAETLLAGKDPCNVVYVEDAMRSHLNCCFSEGELSAFPVSMFKINRRQVVRTKTLSLFCLCRTINVKSKPMIMCNKCKSWWHPECIGMHQSTFDDYCESSRQFLCLSCSPVESVHAEEVERVELSELAEKLIDEKLTDMNAGGRKYDLA